MVDATYKKQVDNLPAHTAEVAQLYLVDLGLSWDELAKKRILDLGAGLGEFAQAALQHDVEVTSLELRPELWEAEGEPPIDIPYVIADAVKLPFDDDSFDVVLSRQGPLGSEENPERFIRMMQEALRVLRPGGQLRFGPTPIAPSIASSELAHSETELEGMSLDDRIVHLASRTKAYLLAAFPGLEARSISSIALDEPLREYFVFQKTA